MNLIQVLILAVVQGITELFPVSSLGHAILISQALQWGDVLKSESFLPLVVALHLGTAGALFLYFWKDWFAFLKPQEMHPVFGKKNADVLMYLVIGTIPAGLLGLIFEKKLNALFSQPATVAIFLIANGALLIIGELIKRHQKKNLKPEVVLTPLHSFLIGTSQSIALLPGFSRSGATMISGILLGLSEEAAAHFSFLLATPIIAAAGMKEVPKLIHGSSSGMLMTALIGGVVAGVFAFLSTAILMRIFKNRELTALIPFGIYCIVIGALSFFLK